MCHTMYDNIHDDVIVQRFIRNAKWWIYKNVGLSVAQIKKSFVRHEGLFFFFVLAKVDFNFMFQGEIGKAVTINPFVTNVPIFYPPENTRKLLVFWCFQSVENRNIGHTWVTYLFEGSYNMFKVNNRNVWTLPFQYNCFVCKFIVSFFDNVAFRGKLSTYKELCSLATSMNKPDLMYKFMNLANHNAIWNSKKVW